MWPYISKLAFRHGFLSKTIMAGVSANFIKEVLDSKQFEPWYIRKVYITFWILLQPVKMSVSPALL